MADQCVGAREYRDYNWGIRALNTYRMRCGRGPCNLIALTDGTNGALLACGAMVATS